MKWRLNVCIYIIYLPCSARMYTINWNFGAESTPIENLLTVIWKINVLIIKIYKITTFSDLGTGLLQFIEGDS